MRLQHFSDSAAKEGATAPTNFSSQDLHDELDRFKQELRAAGLRESTVHSYLMGSRLFIRWLAGDYAPGPGRPGRLTP